MSKLNVDPDSIAWLAYVQWRYGSKGLGLPGTKHMTAELQECLTGSKQLVKTPDGAYAIINK